MAGYNAFRGTSESAAGSSDGMVIGDRHLFVYLYLTLA